MRVVLALAAAMCAAFAGESPSEAGKRVKAALDKKDWQAACDTALASLARAGGDAALNEMLATALERLGRVDEAAHAYDLAARAFALENAADRAKYALANVRRVDPLSLRRDVFLQRAVDRFADCAEDLFAAGHAERALSLLERLPAAAQGKDAARVQQLLAKVRAAFQKVNLEEAAPGAPEKNAPPAPSGRADFEYESEHYRFECALEPAIVKRMGDVMDDIHAYYVQVYFDGDAKKARGAKVKVRIHPDKATMLKSWEGGSAPEGWWSPGENEVHTFDTRTSSGSLDDMLETLFHEASHQFMTLLAGGGFVPAWINEGTASFFEGAEAMADGRVLWPHAALSRLAALSAQLGRNETPSVADVIGFSEPGSYPGSYYSYGWGLVYFLQSYEDPNSLAHVYRPLYAEYRSQVIRKGGEPRAVFDGVFLGKNSPLGHQKFEDFERDWKRWILQEVGPLHARSAETRAKRLERARRYLAAADAAKGDKKAVVPEAELLQRALGEIEYVRGKIDRPESPDGALVVMQADVLERLKRPQSAAPLIESALDLADAGKLELDEKRYQDLSKRLARIDGKNAALRAAKGSAIDLARNAKALLADYERAAPPLLARGYTFASIASGLLPDDAELASAAERLRLAARAAKLLRGSIRALDAKDSEWATIFSTPPEAFDVEGARIALSTVRTQGYVDTRVLVTGEYELRAKLSREGAPEPGSALGFVIAGGPGRDWYLAGFDDRGQAGVWTAKLAANGGVSLRRAQSLFPKPALEPGELPPLAVRVLADGTVQIKLGEREPVLAKIDVAPGVARHVGVFAKNMNAVFEEALVELVP